MPTFANYIDGEWVEQGATFENRNPANTDEVVGLFVHGHGGGYAKPRPTPRRGAARLGRHHRARRAAPSCSRPPTSWTAGSSNWPPR